MSSVRQVRILSAENLRHTRENVGMSSVRQVRILSAENLRFPEEGSSSQG